MQSTSAMAKSHSLVPTFKVLSVHSATPGIPMLEAEMLASKTSYASVSAPRHSAAPISSLTAVSDSATEVGPAVEKLFKSHQSSCNGTAVGAITPHSPPAQCQLTYEFSTTGEFIECLVELQSLLMQLKVEQVRRHFQAGQIMVADRLDMVLYLLDIIGNQLFPKLTVSIKERQMAEAHS